MSRRVTLAVAAVAVAAVAWWSVAAWQRYAQASQLPTRSAWMGASAPVQAQLAEADAAARKAPGDAGAVGHLGVVYYANDLAEPALRCFARAEALDPTDPRWPGYRALIEAERGLAAAGDRPRGGVPPVDPLIEAAVAQSRHVQVLLKHAALAGRRGDRAVQESLLQRALQFHPTDQDVLMEAAVFRLASGRPQEALDLLKTRESLAPDDHHTLVEQGRCLAEMGRLPEAEAVLRRASRVRDAAVDYNLGLVLDRQGRTTEARALFDRALTINPFHVDAMNAIGLQLDRAGQLEEAVRWFRRAMASAPDAVEARVNLGSALIGAQRFAEGAAALEEALRLAPDSVSAHNNLGIAYAQMKRRDEARAQFEATLRLMPNHPNARRNLQRLDEMGRP